VAFWSDHWRSVIPRRWPWTVRNAIVPSIGMPDLTTMVLMMTALPEIRGQLSTIVGAARGSRS
jgi:hypothetical protein